MKPTGIRCLCGGEYEADTLTLDTWGFYRTFEVGEDHCNRCGRTADVEQEADTLPDTLIDHAKCGNHQPPCATCRARLREQNHGIRYSLSEYQDLRRTFIAFLLWLAEFHRRQYLMYKRTDPTGKYTPRYYYTDALREWRGNIQEARDIRLLGREQNCKF